MDNNRPPRRKGPAQRPSSPPPPTGRGRGPSAEDLLALANELEEQGRALMRQARQLHRMADGISSGGSRPPGAGQRGPERGGGETRPRSRAPEWKERGERGEREERGGRGERDSRTSRPARPTRESPTWAPTGKRRKT